MRPTFMMTAAILAITATQSISAQAPAVATAGAIQVDNAWSRESLPGGAGSTAFITIRNSGRAPDRLLSATTPAADRVEVRRNVVERKVARMRAVSGGLVIPARGTVAMKPGGTYIMLVGLKRPLTQHTHVPLTLHFQHAGQIEVMMSIEKLGFTGVEALDHP